MNELEAFRAVAQKKGMPDDAIDWWLRLARPCLYLEKDGSGPVVGHFGGTPSLPASVAWPDDTVHLASIDLAALPDGALDLDLPSDGTLVFFVTPEMPTYTGQVIHVPAGAAVAEAEPPSGWDPYDRFPLHATPNWSLPERPSVTPGYTWGDRDDEPDYRSIVWSLGDEHDGDEVIVLGGHGLSNTGGLGVPVNEERGEVLLAEFFLNEEKVGDDFETDYATVYYTITRESLAAGRFAEVSVNADFHG
ncbi:DUF1963 domain-containing protein [Micromonospora sp. NPDC049048]|uniref:DUF1963 domain-containing protein n=1 Tax=Micromonospora sp. NPDC049048 TaxID=3364263 RepID=UPI0037164A4C